MGDDANNRFKMIYSSPSISGSGKAGVLFRKREAFPLTQSALKGLIVSDGTI